MKFLSIRRIPMKITKIKTYLFYPGIAKNLLFCRVDTDEGLHGWGEAYVGPGKEKAVEAYINSMALHVIGRSPFNIKHTGRIMYDDFVTKRGTPDMYAAWSAIEIALWDIVGKKLGEPVYNLLGGRSREKIRLYANGWRRGAKTIDEIVERAMKVKAMDFTAMKFDPFPGPYRAIIDRKDEDHAVAAVRRVREAVGPEMDIMVEVHRRLAPMHAIRVARRIEEFNPFWFEEPCTSDNVDLVVQVKRAINIPVVTGEALHSKAQFKEVFEKQAADIINPDSCACSGILGLLEIAAMAEPYAIAVSPHNYNGTAIGLMATAQICAVVTNFLIAECFVNLKPACDEIMVQPPKIDHGFLELPSGPGLGIDIDVAKLEKRPFKEPSKEMRQYWEEFPKQG
jgi:galactonate dehydratase